MIFCLLPTMYVVRGKVMCSVMSACLFTEGGGSPYHDALKLSGRLPSIPGKENLPPPAQLSQEGLVKKKSHPSPWHSPAPAGDGEPWLVCLRLEGFWLLLPASEGWVRYCFHRCGSVPTWRGGVYPSPSHNTSWSSTRPVSFLGR